MAWYVPLQSALEKCGINADLIQNEAGESLKNVLLVMNSAQLLVPPPSGQDTRSDLPKEVWDKSHLRIAKILPGFLEDFVAQSEPVAPVSAVPSAKEAEKQVVEEKSDQTGAAVESKA